MKSMIHARKTLSMLALFCCLAFCFFSLAALAPAEAYTERVADDDGKEAFVKNCAECHAVSSEEIEATTKNEQDKGPDLKGIGEKYQKKWITKYIKMEADKDGTQHLKKFKGSDEELQAIVDWLGSLEAQE